MMFYVQAALLLTGLFWTCAGLLLHHIHEEELPNEPRNTR